MKRKIFLLLFLLGIAGFFFFQKRELPSISSIEEKGKTIHLNPTRNIGDVIDNLEGVEVFFNGRIGHVKDRNVTPYGYNLGLRWQCVEFIKRFYYEFLNHKMPNSYGHAKDFFDINLQDGQFNRNRNLTQFSNPSKTKPQLYDIVIFDGHKNNPYGHVAIISKVNENSIEIIQQNMGTFGSSRDDLNLVLENGFWEIQDSGIIGRLSK